MSTGKRLAKRSIVGTRVCALGGDGRYYPGVIHAVRTTAPAGTSSGPGENRYSVRFDSSPPPRRVHPREFRDSEIVGPGFRSVTNVRLRSGQKVFLTYNGREVAGRVLEVGEWEEDRSEEEDEESLGGNAEESAPGENEEEEEFEEEEIVEEGGRKLGRMGRRGRRRGTSVASQAGVEVLVAILPPGHDPDLSGKSHHRESTPLIVRFGKQPVVKFPRPHSLPSEFPEARLLNPGLPDDDHFNRDRMQNPSESLAKSLAIRYSGASADVFHI
ncbi:hypothetical protein J437_LFUL010838 [Ladona fulva]|uniref:DUF4772 domain-containing protein n=1 Tax=Ladona fulva TaxID=123851 RepID=A0A8K0KAU9_LADFU|nr:hypothetical protein J437_LFUL010838 [Ladona fulva]